MCVCVYHSPISQYNIFPYKNAIGLSVDKMLPIWQLRSPPVQLFALHTMKGVQSHTHGGCSHVLVAKFVDLPW